MVEQLLQGFRILIASDHRDLLHLFEAIVEICGAMVIMQAASAAEAVQALRHRPHAVLLDTALPDETFVVPSQAEVRKIPVVVLTFRSEEPHGLTARFRAFPVRFLGSTDPEEVCKVLHDAVREPY